ncbi:MAG: DUF3108 domain-containing protein [Bacteroidota bacterium]
MNEDQSESMMQVGEELVYGVHYSFFNIGTIRMTVNSKESINGREIYHTSAFINSNPALSWLVELHIRFYSGIDQELFSNTWLSEDSSKKGITYRKTWFQYSDNTLHDENGTKTNDEYRPEKFDTTKISGHCQDGLSLFFYARGNACREKEEYVPTCIDSKEVKTYINFLNEREKVEIDSAQYPIDCVHFEGRADFTGIFGLTGGFEGWFSNDRACIPIKAKMNVILGSVKIDLLSWKRSSWTPPRWN